MCISGYWGTKEMNSLEKQVKKNVDATYFSWCYISLKRHPTTHEKVPIKDKTFKPAHCALPIVSNGHKLINIIYCGLTGTLPVFYFKFNNHGIEGKKKSQ